MIIKYPFTRLDKYGASSSCTRTISSQCECHRTEANNSISVLLEGLLVLQVVFLSVFSAGHNIIKGRFVSSFRISIMIKI